jgi:hypothetical protein
MLGRVSAANDEELEGMLASIPLRVLGDGRSDALSNDPAPCAHARVTLPQPGRTQGNEKRSNGQHQAATNAPASPGPRAYSARDPLPAAAR